MIRTTPAVADQPPPLFQFRLAHVFYAMALLGAALATFGVQGLGLALPMLGFWAFIFCRRPYPGKLGEGCALLLIGGCLLGLLLPTFGSLRPTAHRVQCRNQLSQISLALQNYHAAYGEFPPAFVPDQEGRPMHSWRVLILPYLEERARYEQYDFQQPWDGPDNRRLLTPVPHVYQCPSDVLSGRGRSSWTSYVAVLGDRTAWPGSESRKLADFTDGTSQTILIIEDQSETVSWMEPRDLTLDQAISLLASRDFESASMHRWSDFFYEYGGGRSVAFADGRVVYLFDLPPDVAANLLILDDDAGIPSAPGEKSTGVPRRLKLGNCVRFALFIAIAMFPLLRLRS